MVSICTYDGIHRYVVQILKFYEQIMWILYDPRVVTEYKILPSGTVDLLAQALRTVQKVNLCGLHPVCNILLNKPVQPVVAVSIGLNIVKRT